MCFALECAQVQFTILGLVSHWTRHAVASCDVIKSASFFDATPDAPVSSKPSSVVCAHHGRVLQTRAGNRRRGRILAFR